MELVLLPAAVLLLLLLPLVLCICSAVAVLGRRRHANCVVQDGQVQPIIEICDPAIARRALMDHADALCNRPLNLFPVALVSGLRRRQSDNITSVPHGPRWRALRCTLNAAVLHPSRLGHMDPLRLEAIDTLLADLRVRCSGAEKNEIVIRDILNAAVFPMVARTCFGSGVDDGHVRAMRDMLRAFVLAVDGAKDFAGSKTAKLLHWRRWRQFLAFRGRQADLFLPLINARRQNNDAGRHLRLSGGLTPYLDLLLDARVPIDDDGTAGGDKGKALRPLTDDELVSLLSEFLGAGPGTMVSSMEWTLAHLLLQPEVQNKIRREADAVPGAVLSEARIRQMSYTRAVVLESLRLHPPIPFLLRDVANQAEATVVGYAATVPAEGARAHFNLGDIGRDKNAWTDPDAFRPERFLAGGEGEGVGLVPGPKEIKMMPFGAGRRACPGVGLATMHVKSFVAALVREFEWTPPPSGGGVDLTELDGFFKVMKTPLRAGVTLRRQRSTMKIPASQDEYE